MSFEISFLPVGDTYGDAITIRYGDDNDGYYLHVVDGGPADTGQTVIGHIEKYYPNYFINHLVVSHADNDHVCGLIDVLKRFEVQHLWMNRPWLYAKETLQHFHGNFTLQGLINDMKERNPYLVELEEIAVANGTLVHEVFQGAKIGEFTVLAPSRERYIELIPDFGKTPTSYKDETTTPAYGLLKALAEGGKKWLEEKWDVETLSENPQPPTSASNESCVVQYATLDDEITVLLTADVGPAGLSEAANYAATLGLTYPKFIQIPHHGSRHNVTPTILNHWIGSRRTQGTVAGTAYCSIGANKPEYPRGQVKNAFIRRGYEVYANRAAMITYSYGGGLPGLFPITPEPFDDEVEGP